MEPDRVADTTTRIANPFPHIVAGMHIGGLEPRPVDGEFDAILDLGRVTGYAADGVKHAHVHIPYGYLEPEPLNTAVDWTLGQLTKDRSVLIRSERGRQRPALVVGMCVLQLGGRYFDALTCVRRAGASILTDFRYLQHLRETDANLNPR